VVGVIFGSLAVKFLGYQQKKELIEFLSRSINQINHLLDSQPELMVRKIILFNLKWVVIFWGLTISLVGVILIPGIIFLRGFIIGFTVGFLLEEMFFKGLLLALVSVLPHNLILVPSLILGGLFSLVFVFRLVKNLLFNSYWQKRDVLNLIANYSILMIGVALLLLLASLIEGYLTPVLIDLVANLLI
jgi:stage II sporulation protein M